jgi:hypothetical protein
MAKIKNKKKSRCFHVIKYQDVHAADVGIPVI